MLKQDDYIKAKLVEYGWRFAKSYVGAGHIAGQMIMHCIANRVRNGWATWLQVFDGIPNFMAENELPPMTHPSVWDATFVKLLQTVDGIYDGSTHDLSKGALYWGDLAKIEREWFKEKIIQPIYPEGTYKTDQNVSGLPVHNRVANTNGLNFWS